MKDFHELRVWQKAHQLTLAIYQITATFPREELYGLTRIKAPQFAFATVAGATSNVKLSFGAFNVTLLNGPGITGFLACKVHVDLEAFQVGAMVRVAGRNIEADGQTG